MFGNTFYISTITIVFVACQIMYVAGAPLERPIPEFIATSDISEFCDIQVKFTPASQNTLFGFLDSAFEYTNHWRQKFFVVGVDYVNDNSLHIISRKPCSRYSEGARFANAFFAKQIESCNECGKFSFSFKEGSLSPYIMKEQDVQFKTKLQMFLRYRPKSMIPTCTVTFRIPPQPVSHPSSANLFSYINNAQYKYRLPIEDAASGPKNTSDFLFSRQCYAKRILYR
ncbi:MAG: hypothetical protein ACREHV_17055, partial [Rhizomicrobium sp.]